MHKNSTVLLIGSGRLARHLFHWNTLLQRPSLLLRWDRTQNTNVLNELLAKTDIVWLAISDSAIVDFYENHLLEHNQKVVHFSGALNDKRIACAHPLMSFPETLLPTATYENTFFVIEGSATLQEILPGFSNSFVILNAENKSLYHALCVMAGNFPQFLWNEVATNLKKLKIPQAGLDLYIRQITENYLTLREKSITGPIARNDLVTIEKNLNSLNQSQNLKNIYSAFTKEFKK